MLPPFIIEQIRKRETEEHVRREQPQLELPLEPARRAPVDPQEEERRGIIIVEL